MKYPKGQPMSDNVFRALQLAGKIGFLSRALWYDYFATGELRWRQEQLALLIERGLIARHSNTAVKDYFVLTAKSQSLLENHNFITVSPAPIVQVVHDESVVRWLLRLEAEGLSDDWETEPEFKRKQTEEYQLSRDIRKQKYPDAVFKVTALGKKRIFAIEYERTRKSNDRYKDILWLYSRSSMFGMVIFVCENELIQSAIEGRIKYLNIASLWDRIAIARADDWHSNPAKAPLRLENKIITLGEICEKGESKKIAATIAA